MKEGEISWNDCGKCRLNTRHKVVKYHSVQGSEEYNCLEEYCILECCGCLHISFSDTFNDYEYASQDPYTGRWEHPIRTKNYPPVAVEHKSIEKISWIPNVVEKAYSQTLACLENGFLLLSGIGLRCCIEAICNEQNIGGRNLSTRITNLHKRGLISSRDEKRLHGIRFLGNDAAHEILEPKKEAVFVALKIVEHLVNSVYILDSEMSGKIDIPIEGFDEFEALLKNGISKFSSGDENTLHEILGRDIRKILEGIKGMETELAKRIGDGRISYIRLGKVDHYNNSPQKMQFYIKI